MQPRVEVLSAGIPSRKKSVGLATVYLGTLHRVTRGSRVGVAGYAWHRRGAVFHGERCGSVGFGVSVRVVEVAGWDKSR